MKIGIMTFWKASNYGAFLQAYALFCFIKKHIQGADVYFLDYESDSEKRSKDAFKLKQYQSIFPVTNQTDNLDVLIYGSDEIWNRRNGEALNPKAFFGIGELNKFKIAYAPCGLGFNEWKDYLSFDGINILWGIRKFRAISVRDTSSMHILKRFGIPCTKVLDPTFLVNWKIKEIKRDPYIAVYTYSHDAKQEEIIKQFAMKHNFKIICIGKKCEVADETPVLSPWEWLAYLSSAQFVFTQTFHGTVFSLIFHKEFVSFGVKNQKVTELLEQMHLSNRNQKTGRDFDLEVLEQKIDYSQVDTLMNREKKNSGRWLLKAIYGKKK